MTNIPASIINALSTKLNTQVSLKQVVQVFGGDINQTFHLITNSGNFFLKMNANAKPDMFTKEMNGLQLLRSANGLKVPEPIVCGEAEGKYFLIMEFIEKGQAQKDFWTTFAKGLVTQHKTSNTYFGLNEDNYIGSLHQSNTQYTSWANFYNEERIMPLMQLAFNAGKCDAKDIQLAEQLCAKLKNIFPEEKPALLHGDLWSGNFIVGEDGAPVIMDPAVYYGHREMDIAMTLLFGGFNIDLYHFYNEMYPLESQWRKRVSLCQLYPLLVHLNLFGAGYYHQVKQILLQYA